MARNEIRIRILQMLRRKLERSAELTAQRSASATLAARYRRLYSWQVERLIRTYSDLRRQPRYRPATEFFISDLYGPHDVSRRDQDLARALPKLIRMLPDQVIGTLFLALDLHVMTQELDAAMIESLGELLDEPGALNAAIYAEGYRRCDNHVERRRQISLLVQLGQLPGIEDLVKDLLMQAEQMRPALPAHLMIGPVLRRYQQ